MFVDALSSVILLTHVQKQAKQYYFPYPMAIMEQNSSSNNSNGTLTLEKTRSLSPAISEQVRALEIDEYEQAAQCLSEAFAVDEVARYFIDTEDMAVYTEEYKWKLHCDIIRYVTAAHCYSGLVTSVGPNYAAVALW